MGTHRRIHPDFLRLLNDKDDSLITLFTDVRTFLLELYPDANELLYHTRALTAVFSLSDKLGDGFCHVPIYSKHLNLGFNKGAKLADPQKLLCGTGSLIRHIPFTTPADYRYTAVTALVRAAITYAIDDMEIPTRVTGRVVSKIKNP